MSTELKQAAQDAAEAIDWLLKNIRLDAPQLSGKAIGNAEKCASALRAALDQQPATATACGIPGMAKTTCPYCEQGFAFEHEQPATPEPTVPQEHEAYSRYLDAATPDRSAQVFYAADGDDETGVGYHMKPYVHWFSKALAADTKLYTRPVPSLPDSIDPPTEDGTEYDYASGYTAGYAAGWNEYRDGMAWLLDPQAEH